MKPKDKCCFFELIKELSKKYSITLLCKITKVSRSGFYKWLSREKHPTSKQLVNEKLREMIMECHQEVKGIYGYPRIKVWLFRRYGLKVNHKRVYRIMKELGIQALIRKKRKFFGRKEKVVISENKLNRNFCASRPNEKWATDITYILFNGRRLYLSVIYDMYNNEVVAYKTSKRNDLRLVMDTVKLAIKKRDVSGVLLHSDQGYQYTSKQYNQFLQQYKIVASMSRKGNCLDNACIEGFFGHLKTECLYLHSFQTDKEVEEALHGYINFYNQQRFQSRLKNLSPIEYRTQVA
ncbi:transposase [Brevibacillus laterosporus DSM 25]|uniref:IS3 family transposase n=2 Tax=Brevibacillus laterosporus TaxID=1465 RepID=UPI000C05A55E|nr:IS3 family transposase [Brevibacillus laterosporus]ATO48022.1 transposase [Brevibacillus laterosporus DSM 25]ATO48290.1 transposase [Brevibacillus laterosporus DSM 25]ATO48308.1 transposase [Brevibacillus laterosporus DSM 25]ATO48488.1 transposase [Brevibacillus laterosporus DSM 25]ATO49529.1 transposase [Brevibacillus laterosporus DSM 25]